MIRPENVDNSYTAGYLADECGAGVAIFLGGAGVALTEALLIDNQPETAGLGVLTGVLALKGISYTRDYFRYRHRAKELLNEENEEL